MILGMGVFSRFLGQVSGSSAQFGGGMASAFAPPRGTGGNNSIAFGPAAAPVDDVPMATALSHNEEFLASGGKLTMASSNVEEIQYDWFGKLGFPPQTLLVLFKNNARYAYYSVPVEVVLAFIETDSPGRFVWNHLRDRYAYRKLSQGAKPAKRSAMARPNVVRLINR